MPVEPIRCPAEDAAPAVAGTWTGRVIRFLGILFCIEIGAILLIFPWLTWWDQNYFSGDGERWYGIWTSPFFRGAVSGLGMLNLYIAFWDLVAIIRRRAGRRRRLIKWN